MAKTVLPANVMSLLHTLPNAKKELVAIKIIRLEAIAAEQALLERKVESIKELAKLISHPDIDDTTLQLLERCLR